MINLTNIKIEWDNFKFHYLICASSPNCDKESASVNYSVIECKGFEMYNGYTPSLIRANLYNHSKQKATGYAVYYPQLNCIGAPYYVLDQEERLVDATENFFFCRTDYLVKPLFSEEIFKHPLKPKFKASRKGDDQLKFYTDLVLGEIIDNALFMLKPAYSIPIVEIDYDKNLYPSVSENLITLNHIDMEHSQFIEFSLLKRTSTRLPTYGSHWLVPVRISTNSGAKLHSGLAIYNVLEKKAYSFAVHTSKKELIFLSDKDRLESEGIFVDDSNLVYDYMFDKEGLDIKDIKNLFNN